MNKIILIGRLVKNPEVRVSQTNEGLVTARFTIAVNRKLSKDNQADFINCIAFGKLGEVVDKFFTKGQMIAVNGRLQINNYTDKEGNKKTSTDVVVDEIDFCGGKSEADKAESRTVEEVNDDDLPF